MKRQMPENLGDVMFEILSAVDGALDLTRQSADAAWANSQAVLKLVEGLRERPTKQQALRAVTLLNGVALVILVLVGLLFYSELRQGQVFIRRQVQSEQTSDSAHVCSILNDHRLIHGVAAPAPGCE